jgi:Tol biopolymer transport system component
MPITDVSWRNDELQIATSSEDGIIRVWDPNTADLIEEISFNLSLAKTAIAWSNANNVIAFGDIEGGVTLWNLDTNASIFHFTDHTDKINELISSPDGTRLASASQDGTVKIWDTQSGVILGSFIYPGPVYALDWHPDGSEIAYGGLDLSGAEPQVVQIEAPDVLPPTPMPPTAVPTTAVPPTAIPTTALPTTPAPTAVPTPGAGWIVFSSNRDGVGQRSLYAARPDDTSAVRLTFDAGVIDRWPAWNPDRTLIAFTRTNSAGNEDIYIKRVMDNSAPVALGSLVNGATSNERQPVWPPAAQNIGFAPPSSQLTRVKTARR